MARLRIAGVVVLLLASSANAQLDQHLKDLLAILNLTRSDLGIYKDYLPDPDRLPLNRNLLRDPYAGPDWLRTFSDSLAAAGPAGMIARASGLLGKRLLNRETGNVSIASVTQRKRMAGATSLVGLVHPDSALSARRRDNLIAEGRRVRLDSLISQTVKYFDAVLGLPFEVPTPFGTATIGSTGPDVYTDHHALILDPGGDDIYVGVAGVSSESAAVSICVDWSGDDRYEGRVASGLGGIGLLVDRGGDDTYVGLDETQGAGIAGFGVLLDISGDDRYSAGVASQGFGLYGLGLLIDKTGNDNLECEFLGQGAAGPGGVGILLDREGTDVYAAGGRYPDFREEGVYTRSMSQGFSLGLQTEASGGVGMLIDLSGDDDYRVEYFGQGASHWGGVGVLHDRAGDDTYRARRYAQGSGVHLSAGLLVDDLGNDVYSMWGVGQGCGHDLATGVLADGEGDDIYTIKWLGQGAASGNGVGILLEHAGDDVYKAGQQNTQGYGEVSRNFGSVGVLLDGNGRDKYRATTGQVVTTGTVGGRYDVGEVSP